MDGTFSLGASDSERLDGLPAAPRTRHDGTRTSTGGVGLARTVPMSSPDAVPAASTPAFGGAVARSQPYRIALVISSLGGGGAEHIVSGLATRWARLGLDVSVVTLGSRTTDAYDLDPGVRRVTLNLLRPSRHAVEGIVQASRRIVALRRALVSLRPDVIVSFMTSTNVLALLSAIGGGPASSCASAPILAASGWGPTGQHFGGCCIRWPRGSSSRPRASPLGLGRCPRACTSSPTSSSGRRSRQRRARITGRAGSSRSAGCRPRRASTSSSTRSPESRTGIRIGRSRSWARGPSVRRSRRS